MASWYGYKFNGERTSNGELYDMFAMTGAHKTLPIPSYVRVTNLDNHKTVIVRINDRGPFHDGRIIDLSYAAAQRLGITRMGTGNVEVEAVVPDDDPRPPLLARKKELIATQPTKLAPKDMAAVEMTKTQVAKEISAQESGIVSKTEAGVSGADTALPQGTFLQIGAFGVEASAKQFANTVGSKLTFPVIISKVLVPNKLFRVRVGPFSDAASLQSARDQLQKIDILQTHVVYQ
jgi:rare lipoprotein A